MNDKFSTHIKGTVHPKNKHLHFSCSDFCLFPNVQEIDPALHTKIQPDHPATGVILFEMERVLRG